MLNTDQIQASTTNTIGLMATPCMLTGQDHKARVTVGPKQTSEPVAFTADRAELRAPHATRSGEPAAPIHAVAGQILTQCCQRRPDRDPATGHLLSGVEDTDETSLDRLLCVERHGHDGDHRDAMRRTWTRTGQATEPQTPCPDGIAWCLGDPGTHADPREHRHEGPEYGLTGSYVQGARTEGIVAFHIDQWDDDEPRLVFQSDGTWPDMGLTQVDELIGDAVPWLVSLIATRRRLAIELKPSRTPFAESEDKQTASAAFDLATKAIDVALAKTEDRAGMFRALRSFLSLTEDERA